MLINTEMLRGLFRRPALGRVGDDTRGSERLRQLRSSAALSMVAKLVTVGTNLITVPLTLHYLGTERYGIWVTVSSFPLMLSMADLGIGNGLMSAVASASGRDDHAAIRGYISSALVVLSAIFCVILAAIAVVFAFSLVDWGTFFNVRQAQARAETAPVVLVFLLCFAANIPLGIVQRVQTGLQRGWLVGLWASISSVVTLMGVLLAIWSKAGLPWLILALSGTPVAVMIVNLVLFFGFMRPDIAPRLRDISWHRSREILHLGTLFFLLQTSVAVALFSDNLVITRMLGAAYVAEYAIPDRLFSIASLAISMATAPLWPAFTEAIARGDHSWVRLTLFRGILIAAVISGLAVIVLTVVAHPLLDLWVGSSVNPPLALIVGMAMWRFLEATSSPAVMFMNARRAIPLQIGMAVALATSVITLEILLIGRGGITVLPWITCAMYLLTTVIPTMIFIRRVTRV